MHMHVYAYMYMVYIFYNLMPNTIYIETSGYIYIYACVYVQPDVSIYTYGISHQALHATYII